ncbi:hypothetical protein [Methylocaldum szegediense]|uniref:hypothetical protein n=1 Tax=Methylocaldum szegediense TaxID=73780 RepID=UPI00040B925F|nr:hypothetical protein [Methylocaldum szegediense]
MAAKKYLSLNNGRLQEVQATVVSSGAADDGKIPALDPTGKLDQSVMPVGIGADTKIIQASEALAAGDFVNIWNDGGTSKVRKADATTAGKEADGFVLAAVASGGNATVYFEGTNTQLSELTPGSRYYLSTTAGGVTDTSPSGSGNVVQYLGKAISTTEISFEKEDGVILA